MTTRDYIKIAKTIAYITRYQNESYRALVIEEFAKMLRADNPRFDYNAFSRACKGE